MKTTTFTLIALFFIMFAVSCKKKYKCVCNDGNIENPYTKKFNKVQAEVEKGNCEAQPSCVFMRAK